MKFQLALLPLLISTSVFANNAILNVEGEIQINGKTVIDNQGNVIGNDSISRDKYHMDNGVYTYHFFVNNEFEGKQVLTMTDSGNSSIHYTILDDGTEKIDTTSTTEYLEDGRSLQVYTNFYSWEDCDYSQAEPVCNTVKETAHYNEDKVSILKAFPDRYTLGTSVTEVYTFETISSYTVTTYENGDVKRVDNTIENNTDIRRWSFEYGAHLNTININGLDAKGCLINESDVICDEHRYYRFH